MATADDDWRRSWEKEVPFLQPITLPIAGARPFVADPDARAALGLDPRDQTALIFGSGANADRDTVVDAFSELEDWTLVIAGAIADGLGSDRAPSASLVIRNGIVDDETRKLLFSAADLVVLSFRSGYWSDSGVLMDAISAGLPVASSDESSAAAVVREYGLGAVFAPGDAGSLGATLQRALDEFDPAGLERARNERSNRAVALGQLRALDLSMPD